MMHVVYSGVCVMADEAGKRRNQKAEGLICNSVAFTFFHFRQWGAVEGI